MTRLHSSSLSVLSIVHEAGELGGGGLFENHTVELGHGHTRWLPSAGPAPAPAGDYDAIMVFGGPMHPDQDELHPWLPGEADYIRDALAAEVPLLGVCLGAQLISRAADGGVHPADRAEVGWCPVALTPEGAADAVVGALPPSFTAFQWHYYAWRLPPGGTLLATSDAAPQAFRLGERVWAVQFHPEVSAAMVEAWSVGGEAELPVPIDDMRARTRAEIERWNETGTRLCGAFLRAAERLGRGGQASSGSDASAAQACHEPT